MRDWPFTVVGDVPDEWVDRLAEFVRQLVSDPWGGRGLELLLVGDVVSHMRAYMPAERFAGWRTSQSNRSVTTAAISFRTADGRRAAAVPGEYSREIFLSLAAHEAIEAALDVRHDAEGHVFKEQTHTSLAHVLWTEYVVERTRQQLFRTLQLPASPLDGVGLASQMDDFAQSLPRVAREAARRGAFPAVIAQHWYELARVYAMSVGRADAGSVADEQDLEAFRQHRVTVESASGWNAVHSGLRDAFDHPGRSAEDQDQHVRAAWLVLYESETAGLAKVWNPRYAAAAAGRH